ncbi:MAG: hypothetical protein M1832_006210 [Thelocarpon impressellum]|nr:MAG: hypothetical protein M1832_006210 [Thelocarpon impressellum]
MGFYTYNFIALIAGCAGLKYRQHRQDVKAETEKAAGDEVPDLGGRVEADNFKKTFMVVYLLVMGADWLQGPYVYALYKDEMGFAESTIAALFTTGFLSGAISGYFVGSLADRHGRRMACLLFCCTYSLACFSTLSISPPVLFVGRVFGGLSTSLMYSAFESWMVTEFHNRGLAEKGASLSGIFGTMTTMNSIVAIVAGVVSEWLVELTGTKRAPFMASAMCLAVAFWVMWTYWGENYGDSAQQSTVHPEKSALRLVFEDKRILTIGLASCFFEGSMYLFVFFWTPALKATRPSAAGAPDLPFGMIFASFMGAVMLGSLLFSALLTSLPAASPARFLTATFALASAMLLLTVIYKNERVTFWSFCVFEACVGIYFPSIGSLKGKVIDDGVRARVYGMLRIPLNIFVVVALSLTKEGAGYRDTVFMVCSGFLVLASGVLQSVVAD